MQASNINHLLAQTIIQLLVKRGIDYFVISPGSRSTPLAMAAYDNFDSHCHLIIDERAAAYYAVGLIKGDKKAALICTSGTAAANYFPAIIEACQSQLPLICLTADRPLELQNRGANQTIDQNNLYGKFANSFTLEAPDDKIDIVKILELQNNILNQSGNIPVQLNCRFREPLAPVKQDYNQSEIENDIEEWFNNNFRIETPKLSISTEQLDSIIDKINNISRGLIIAAPQASANWNQSISLLAQKTGWPVLADILSPAISLPDAATHYDLYIDHFKLSEKFDIDLIMQFGGLPTSKRLQQFLIDQKGIPQLKIQDHNRTIDPDRVETDRLVISSTQFDEQLIPRIDQKNTSPHKAIIDQAEKIASLELQKYDRTEKLDSINLMRTSLYNLVDDSILFLGNSLPVREADTFLPPLSAGIQTAANRGVSGIDGVIATACGMASGSLKRTRLLIGDLSALHDLNSFRLVKESAIPVTVIINNNNGGGIFHHLPIAEYPEYFEPLFGTPHNFRFENIAAMFALPYYNPATPADFKKVLTAIEKSHQSAVIEINTNRAKNIDAVNALRAEIHRALDGAIK